MKVLNVQQPFMQNVSKSKTNQQNKNNSQSLRGSNIGNKLNIST